MFIIYRAERFKDFFKRQIAFAEKTVFNAVHRLFAVFYMYVFDMFSEIFNGDIGFFARKSVRVMHVPHRRKIVARKLAKHIGEKRRVGVNAHRFDKKSDTVFLRDGKRCVYNFFNRCVAGIVVTPVFRISVKPYVFSVQIFRERY